MRYGDYLPVHSNSAMFKCNHLCLYTLSDLNINIPGDLLSYNPNHIHLLLQKPVPELKIQDPSIAYGHLDFFFLSLVSHRTLPNIHNR
jgi:hypothetical protein